MHYIFFRAALYFLCINSIYSSGYNGLILYSNSQGVGTSHTYLMNNGYSYVNIWNHSSGVVGIPHLNPDRSIIVQTKSADHSFGNSHGPIGGIFQKLDWDGNTLWNYNYYSDTFHPHHDIEVLPNGNILVLGWEKKSLQEAQAVGRLNIINEIWPLMIVEIQPIDPDSAIIIWEWQLWDHLIQDVDSTIINYGQIYDHPELIDINIGQFTNPNSGDWLHTNAIAYNQGLDQIVFSSRHFDEIFIIDHSTTIEQAANHQGGNSNKGGDILYRWGNPINYGRGTSDDQMLNAQHGVNWITSQMPGEDNLIIFNNNPTDTTGQDNTIGNSSVVEIVTPINSAGTYDIVPDSAYGPSNYHWVYGADSTFFSHFQSGAYRLENGNTFVTVSQEKYMFEIDSQGYIVWEYNLGNVEGNSGNTARAKKYELNYLETGIGDLNSDHLVNIYDLIKTINLIIEGQYNEKADHNYDSEVNNLDLDILIDYIMSF